MRELLANHGFTISVYFAVAITAMFAFVFEASQVLVATLLVLSIRAGRTRLSFESGTQAVTSIKHRVSGNVGDCTVEQEICI